MEFVFFLFFPSLTPEVGTPSCYTCPFSTTQRVAFYFGLILNVHNPCSVMFSLCVHSFLNVGKVVVVFPYLEDGNVHTSTAQPVYVPNKAVLYCVCYNGSLPFNLDHLCLLYDHSAT